jgi:hypothetical protein
MEVQVNDTPDQQIQPTTPNNNTSEVEASNLVATFNQHTNEDDNQGIEETSGSPDENANEEAANTTATSFANLTNSSPVSYRSAYDRPVHKLSVKLIDTYKYINKVQCQLAVIFLIIFLTIQHQMNLNVLLFGLISM